MLSRRRFLAITAALPMGLSAGPSAALAPMRGQALGAVVTLHIDHPDASRMGALALAEIARLERIFSLFLPDSSLVSLNTTGRLDAPPPELLALLTVCGTLHHASGGRFDPTVQPLWAALAQGYAGGGTPDRDTEARARDLIGWAGVSFDGSGVAFARTGMALTLNGIAQGFVADRVATLLRAQGLEVGLVDTGEHRALSGDWPIRLDQGPVLRLTDRALATSGPFGTVLDREGRQGHILSPQQDRAAPVWSRITISAPTATVADGLSTAACLMRDRPSLDALVARFPGARIELALPA